MLCLSSHVVGMLKKYLRHLSGFFIRKNVQLPKSSIKKKKKKKNTYLETLATLFWFMVSKTVGYVESFV